MPAEGRKDNSNALVLVVDDNEMSRTVLTHRVERLGHDVSTAGSGAEALKALEENAPDLVLLDIVMPDMDGREVLLRLKADPRFQALPVIVVSGLDTHDAASECVAAGACDFLHKPVNGDDLMDSLAMWLPGGSTAKRAGDTAEAGTGGSEILPDPAEAPVFDNGSVAQLCADYGNETTAGFIAKFESLVPDLRDGVINGAKGGEIAEWRHAAHDLKGGARTLGLERLAALCRVIEHACHEGRTDDARDATERLDDYLEQGLSELRQYAAAM